MKVLKKIARYVIIFLISLTGILLLFIAFSIAPLDRTPMSETEAYARMMARVDSLDQLVIPRSQGPLSVGFGKVNLTPPFKTATAGYGKRRGMPFTSVHDSVFVRALVLGNKTQRVAIVSADLLIIPPAVTEVLNTKLKSIGFSLDNTFLGAIHTHNSIGNWGKGAAGLLYGAYEDTVVNFIADAIVRSIETASQNLVSSKIYYKQVAMPAPVDNRLLDGGPEDPLTRAIEIQRSDSSRLLLMTYTAHATCLFSADMELSRDYPGRLVDVMEESGYDFSMFMAGAVGSHGCHAPEMGYNCINWMADEISREYLHSKDSLHEVSDPTLYMKRVKLELADPQVKISEKWKVRTWLFRAALGEYPVYLNALRIGDIVMLGVPCDYSGEFNFELDSLARSLHGRIITTSFNGGYIGYVTPVKYYDRKHYETQLMNWYPPGNGEYITYCLEKLARTISK
jgi:neutral ceramidase